MKNYKAILTSSVVVGTYAAQLKAITKVKAATEDNTLKELIDGVVQRLQDKYAFHGSQVVPAALEMDRDQRIQKLLSYCKQKLKAKVPEWQVLALKHGWKPTRN